MESWVDQLIQLKDRDLQTLTEDDYQRRHELKLQLFGTSSLHDAFAKKYPNFCSNTVIVLNQDSIRVFPRQENLFQCLKRACCMANGVYLYHRNHSNILWSEPTTRRIYRYDPQFGSDHRNSQWIDSELRQFFQKVLPAYRYVGNTLPTDQCVQSVRRRINGYLDCFCQEYTLLYAQRRLDGLSHSEAADDLVNSLPVILDQIRDLYRDLAN